MYSKKPPRQPKSLEEMNGSNRQCKHFTDKENKELLRLYIIHGNKWTKIAKELPLRNKKFPKRSANVIQYHFGLLIKNKKKMKKLMKSDLQLKEYIDKKGGLEKLIKKYKKDKKQYKYFSDKEYIELLKLYIIHGNKWTKITKELQKNRFLKRNYSNVQWNFESLIKNKEKIDRIMESDLQLKEYIDKKGGLEGLIREYEKNKKQYKYFSDEEDKELLELYAQYGNQWTKIAEELPLRNKKFPKRVGGVIQQRLEILNKNEKKLTQNEECINYFKLNQLKKPQTDIHEIQQEPLNNLDNTMEEIGDIEEIENEMITSYDQTIQQTDTFKTTGIHPFRTYNQQITDINPIYPYTNDLRYFSFISNQQYPMTQFKQTSEYIQEDVNEEYCRGYRDYRNYGYCRDYKSYRDYEYYKHCRNYEDYEDYDNNNDNINYQEQKETKKNGRRHNCLVSIST